MATFKDIEYQGLLLRLCMRACKRAEAKKEREIVGPYIYDMAYSALSLSDSALYDSIVFYPYIARSTGWILSTRRILHDVSNESPCGGDRREKLRTCSLYADFEMKVRLT